MPNPTFRRWTADDIAKLKNMAQREPRANVAAQLGRSVGATAVKAHQLGISLKVPRQGGGALQKTRPRVIGRAPGAYKEAGRSPR
jgi:hypothetical protein